MVRRRWRWLEENKNPDIGCGEISGDELLRRHRGKANCFVLTFPRPPPPTPLPPGTTLATPWPELYYRNLVRHFVDEILEDRPQECTFFDGAKSQEIVDAFILAHRERRWVDVGK